MTDSKKVLLGLEPDEQVRIYRALQHKERTKRGHVLIEPKDCDCRTRCPDEDWYRGCPVCDHGLGVCKVCGAAEVELYDYDCPMPKGVSDAKEE